MFAVRVGADAASLTVLCGEEPTSEQPPLVYTHPAGRGAAAARTRGTRAPGRVLPPVQPADLGAHAARHAAGDPARPAAGERAHAQDALGVWWITCYYSKCNVPTSCSDPCTDTLSAACLLLCARSTSGQARQAKAFHKVCSPPCTDPPLPPHTPHQHHTQGLVLDVKGLLGPTTDVPALLSRLITPPEPAALQQGEFSAPGLDCPSAACAPSRHCCAVAARTDQP